MHRIIKTRPVFLKNIPYVGLSCGMERLQCSAKEGEYKIPGGGMEAGETYVEALAREVKEETGLFIIPEKAVDLARF